jgi:ParB family chromosome partitioning protein
MAKAKPQIVLGNFQLIPFNKLVLSQSNVRRVKNGASIEVLAEDIAHRGLLQNLNVRPFLDKAGEETGMYDVPAGGRRFLALGHLVKQKRFAKDGGVPCNLKPANDPISAEEDSLAENHFRSGLHPLDEFRAFHDLSEKGMGHETIAARFTTTPQVVKQRLKLACVSPKLLEVYGANEMTLDQLMAFTLSDDHARQEQVWEDVKDGVYSDEPSEIKALLTEDTVATDDKRVRYFGLDKYVEAGGYVRRDLFDEQDGGYLEDTALVDRLFTEQLKADGEKIGAEGWKWVQVSSSFPVGHTSGMRRIHGRMVPLTDEEHAQRQALRDEQEAIEEKYDGSEDCPEEVSARYDELEEAIGAFEDRPLAYDPVEMAYAGAFVRVDNLGRLVVERGFVRREDEPRQGAKAQTSAGGDDIAEDDDSSVPEGAVVTVGDGSGEDETDNADTIRPLPDKLVSELTSERTVALQDAVAQNAEVAFIALLHKFCTDIFYHQTAIGCLDATVRSIHMPIQAPGLEDSPSAQAQEEREKHFQSELPESDEDLWGYLVGLPAPRRMELLAFCVSQGVSALHDRGTEYQVRHRIGEADRLAEAVGLDMVAVGWRPRVENYLGRVTKSRILEAVREAKGESAAQLIGHLKKDDMAKEAERLLEGTGWLPEPLRGSAPAPAEEALPDFLADDQTAEAA